MQNSKIFYFNRGLKLALCRFALLIAFFALVASGASYVFVASFYEFLDSHWHFIAIRGVAIATATFWIFLGVCLIARFCHAHIHYQRLNSISLLRSSPTLVKEGFYLCAVFAVASIGAWLALLSKHGLLQVPVLGLAASILLAWLPFFVMLMLKLFPVVLAAVLYLVVPQISIQGHSLKHSCLRMILFWKRMPLETLLYTLAGLAPLALAAWLVGSLQKHTLGYLGYDDALWVVTMRKFVLSFASAGVLAPAVSLFAAWGVESISILEQRSSESPYQF